MDKGTRILDNNQIDGKESFLGTMTLIEVKLGPNCESSQLSSPRSRRGSIPRIHCKHCTIKTINDKQHTDVK